MRERETVCIQHRSFFLKRTVNIYRFLLNVDGMCSQGIYIFSQHLQAKQQFSCLLKPKLTGASLVPCKKEERLRCSRAEQTCLLRWSEQRSIVTFLMSVDNGQNYTWHLKSVHVTEDLMVLLSRACGVDSTQCVLFDCIMNYRRKSNTCTLMLCKYFTCNFVDLFFFPSQCSCQSDIVLLLLPAVSGSVESSMCTSSASKVTT